MRVFFSTETQRHEGTEKWWAAWAGACPTRRCAVSCRLSRVDKKLRLVSPASTGSVVAGERLSYGGEPLRSSRATPARAA